MRKALWMFLALTACATRPLQPLRPVDVPTVPYVEGAAAEDVTGSLVYDEDGCLTFRAKGGERLLPIWPRSSLFNGTSFIFHRPGKADQALLVNEEIQISGERLPLTYAQTSFGTYVQRCGGVPFFVAKVRPAD